jgi:threonine dehydrogenase-like Zn-dependent dehydrogenase
MFANDHRSFYRAQHRSGRPPPVGGLVRRETARRVEEVGSRVTNLQPGDRVVIPFQISCGRCFMCVQGLQTQCETTQVRDRGMGAAPFGFTKLYGEVLGGRTEFLRVPQSLIPHHGVEDHEKSLVS